MKRKRLRHLIGSSFIILACLALYFCSKSDIPAASSVFTFCGVFFSLSGIVLLGMKDGCDAIQEDPYDQPEHDPENHY